MTPQEKDYLLNVVCSTALVAKANELPINLDEVDHFIVKSTPAQKTNSHVSVVANDGRVRSFSYNRENIKDVLNTVLGANPTLPLTYESTAADLATYLTEQGITITAEELEVSYIGTTSVLVKTTKHCIRYFGQGYFALGAPDTRARFSELAFNYNTETNEIEYTGKVTPAKSTVLVKIRGKDIYESVINGIGPDGVINWTEAYTPNIFASGDVLEFTAEDTVPATVTLTPSNVQNLPTKGFVALTAWYKEATNEIGYNGYGYGLSQGFNVYLANGTLLDGAGDPNTLVNGQITATFIAPEGFAADDTIVFKAVNIADGVADQSVITGPLEEI